MRRRLHLGPRSKRRVFISQTQEEGVDARLPAQPASHQRVAPSRIASGEEHGNPQDEHGDADEHRDQQHHDEVRNQHQQPGQVTDDGYRPEPAIVRGDDELDADRIVAPLTLSELSDSRRPVPI